MARMRTLYLLRHAKSAWDDPDVEDHDRPLAPRGKRAARAIAKVFRGLKADPQLVLCSTAARTRETLDLVMPGFTEAPLIAVERGLYLAAAESILARLHQVDDRIERALVIGHNPGLQELALMLGQTSPAKLHRAIGRKFPTAALATYEWDGAWAALAPDTARLTAFVTPADLEVE
jgi:phosphohistidine phosphatase